MTHLQKQLSFLDFAARETVEKEALVWATLSFHKTLALREYV